MSCTEICLAIKPILSIFARDRLSSTIDASKRDSTDSGTLLGVGETILGVKFDDLGETIGISFQGGSKAKVEDEMAHV